MIIVHDARALRAALEARRAAGSVALVPTMGALHRGHRSLFEQARRSGGTLVASVFVNPKQFNDPADLQAYPRDEEGDAAVCAASGVDVLFAPDAATIYPAGHATAVTVGGAACGLEGDHRPGHFDGVATVCLILFNLVRPQAAWFGQKDAQQVAVIRQLVGDLAVNVDNHVGPTVRDPDEVALSSRNRRLAPADRDRARAIPRALRAAVRAHRAGADPADAARAELADLDVEYVDVATFSGQATLVVAARCGRVRLIDKVPLDRPALAGL
jgi:pantoate--beta-alanine ligase